VGSVQHGGVGKLEAVKKNDSNIKIKVRNYKKFSFRKNEVF
jgi:hypothetical protein